MRLKNVNFGIVNFVLLLILLVLVIILFSQRKTDKEYFNYSNGAPPEWTSWLGDAQQGSQNNTPQAGYHKISNKHHVAHQRSQNNTPQAGNHKISKKHHVAHQRSQNNTHQGSHNNTQQQSQNNGSLIAGNVCGGDLYHSGYCDGDTWPCCPVYDHKTKQMSTCPPTNKSTCPPSN